MKDRKFLLKRVVMGRFWPLDSVYCLANGMCGIRDDGEDVLLQDGDAKTQ